MLALQRARSRCHTSSGQLGVPICRAATAHGALEQRGLGQRAQAVVQRVVPGCGAEVRTQVGPGRAERVFVERRLVLTVHFVGLHALGRHQRHGLGQPRLRRRVAALAGVEVDAHVQHGQRGALHQPDLRAAGLRPVLYGQQRPRGIYAKNGDSAHE